MNDILNKNIIDILCISEAKLNDGIIDKDIDCSPNFKVYRKDRSSISDGLCTWIRSDLPQQRLYYLEIDWNVLYYIESMIFELKIRKQRYLILVYKTPNVLNNMFLSKLKVAYESLINKAHEIILLGDLNIDILQQDNELQNELCHIFDLDNPIS